MPLSPLLGTYSVLHVNNLMLKLLLTLLYFLSSSGKPTSIPNCQWD